VRSGTEQINHTIVSGHRQFGKIRYYDSARIKIAGWWAFFEISTACHLTLRNRREIIFQQWKTHFGHTKNTIKSNVLMGIELALPGLFVWHFLSFFIVA
jgi:hypothetical protein